MVDVLPTCTTKELEDTNSSYQNGHHSPKTKATAMATGERSTLSTIFKNQRYGEKITFVLSIAVLIANQYALCLEPSIILYIYTVLYPILYVLRVFQFIGENGLLFLLDACYFTNFFTLIIIWAAPTCTQAFQVQFGISNGPVLWAVLAFRNTLAFHNLDKVTSVFIHHLPPLISFCVRWYPAETSKGWYTSFGNSTSVISPISAYSPGADWIWIFVVPLSFIIIRDTLYAVIIRIIIKPGSSFKDSFTFFKSQKALTKVFECVGPRYELLIYLAINWTVFAVATSMSVLFYQYFLAHCIVLAFQGLVVVWNGASYYMDYFAYRRQRKRTIEVLYPEAEIVNNPPEDVV